MYIYDSLYDELNNLISGRTKIFIPYSMINEDGSFLTCEAGINLVNNEQGLTFIVDEFVPEQFMKLKIDNSGFIPKLIVKDGENLEDPISPEERLIIEKEQELIRLKSELFNNTNNI